MKENCASTGHTASKRTSACLAVTEHALPSRTSLSSSTAQRSPMSCPECSYTSFDKSHMKRHFTNKHGNRNNCQSKNIHAKVSASSKHTIKRRKCVSSANAVVLSKKWHFCPYCNFKSVWKASVYKHKVKLHADLIASLKESSKTSGSASEEQSAYCNAADVKPALDLCNKTARSGRIFRCSKCSVVLSTRDALHRHMLNHLDLRRYKCPLCSHRANQLSNMKRHVKNVHGNMSATAIRLSWTEAKRTIGRFKKASPVTSHNQNMTEVVKSKCPSKSTSVGKLSTTDSAAASFSETSVSECGGLKKSNTSSRHGSAGMTRLYECSICKRLSCHSRSIRRHLENVHSGETGEVCIVGQITVSACGPGQSNSVSGKKRKFAAQTRLLSKLPRWRKRESINRFSRTKNVNVPLNSDSSSAIESTVTEHDTQSTTSVTVSHSHVKHQPAKQKVTVRTLYNCTMCPYKTVRLKLLAAHRRLHTRRTGHTHVCSYCPYFASHARHLELHLKLHDAAKSVKADALLDNGKKPKSSFDLLSVSVSTDASEKVTASDASAPCCHVSEPGKLLAEDIGTEHPVAVAEPTESQMKVDDVMSVEDRGSSGAHNSVSGSQRVPQWCCEHCPYSTSKLNCFKRHVWLHGKQYQYECRYCDYSVQSYWQLVSHLLWHTMPNKHLLYSQAVSNLDSFPAQLPTYNNIPDDAMLFDSSIPSFETSSSRAATQLCDTTEFACNQCPYIAQRRSELFAHIRCHTTRALAAAFTCPQCSFSTDMKAKLLAHIRLHFNLAGCRMSTLPPSLLRSHSWSPLVDAIEHSTSAVTAQSVAQLDSNADYMQRLDSIDISCVTSETVGTECSSDTVPTSSSSSAVVTGSEAVAADVCKTDTMNFAHRSSEHQHSGAQLSVVTWSMVSSSLSSAADVAAAVVQYENRDDGCAVANVPQQLADVQTVGETDCQGYMCHYCDSTFNSAHELAKHKARHLLACNHLRTTPAY